MADQFDAMVSGVPTDPTQQQALAQALRRQATLGQMYQATGDRVISPLGEDLSRGAQQSGQSIAGEREKQSALAQTLAIHQAQQDQAMKIAQMTDARSREATASNDQLRRDLLTQRDADALARQNAKKDDAPGKPLPMGTFKDVSALKDSLDAINDSISNYKPEFSGAGKVSRNATNYMSANFPTVSGALGLVNQDDKDAANWYQNYGRNFTIDEMHRLFGARISPTEMATFEKYHINPSQSPDVQMQNMTQIQKRVADKINQRLDALQAGGYNSDQIAAMRPEAPGNSSASASAATPASQYVRAATQAITAPKAPAAPAAPGLAAPSGSLFPQSTGQMPMPTRQLPFVPGINNLFSGIPSGSPQ
jgi:hypothetical protein